jgi:uncharacterized membrane protein YeiB
MTTVVATADTLPVATATRMDVLDVLRGVAIFGILVYNIGGALGRRDGAAGGTPRRRGRGCR